MKTFEIIIIIVFLTHYVWMIIRIIELGKYVEKLKKDVYNTFGIILTRIDKIESQKYLIKEKEW